MAVPLHQQANRAAVAGTVEAQGAQDAVVHPRQAAVAQQRVVLGRSVARGGGHGVAIRPPHAGGHAVDD
jgi:hypothetical protein